MAQILDFTDRSGGWKTQSRAERFESEPVQPQPEVSSRLSPRSFEDVNPANSARRVLLEIVLMFMIAGYLVAVVSIFLR
jgi:hypothetical protein